MQCMILREFKYTKCSLYSIFPRLNRNQKYYVNNEHIGMNVNPNFVFLLTGRSYHQEDARKRFFN